MSNLSPNLLTVTVLFLLFLSHDSITVMLEVICSCSWHFRQLTNTYWKSALVYVDIKNVLVLTP